MNKIVLFVILALIGIFCSSSLFALLDLTLTDAWDLGAADMNRLYPLGSDNYLSIGCNSLDVYNITPGSLEKVQILYSTDALSTCEHFATAGNKVFVLTTLRGVLVYEILADHTLAYLGSIPLQADANGLLLNNFLWTDGYSMVLGRETFTSSSEVIRYSYMDVYNIANLNDPQLLARHQFSIYNMITGLHSIDDGYYLSTMVGGVYHTTDLLSLTQENILQNYSNTELLRRSFWYMGKLHVMCEGSGGFSIFRCSADANHLLTRDWTFSIPQVWYSYWYIIQPDRFALIGLVGTDAYILKSYITSADGWTLEYSIPWLGTTLAPLGTGYLGGGLNQTNYYDHQFQLQQTLSEHPYGRVIQLIQGRWAVMCGTGEFEQQPLRIFDLQTRQWIPETFTKGTYLASFRQNADYLCIVDDYALDIVRLDADASYQVQSFETEYFNAYADVWENKIAVAHGYSGNGLLKIYDCSSGVLNELGDLPLGGPAIYGMLFYDPNHLVLSRAATGGVRLDFYRIETTGEITLIFQHLTQGYSYLYLQNNTLLVGGTDSSVIDVSDPDLPFVRTYVDPLNSEVYLTFISHDGGNNYLFSNFSFAESFIMDSDLQRRDSFISELPFYRSPNHILLQGYSCLIEAEHPAFVDINDPQIPEIDNLLSLPYPNPFCENVTVDMDIRQQGPASVDIFNIRGQKVRALQNGYLSKGSHSLYWDGCDSQGSKVAAGIYLLRLQTAGQSYTRKLVRAR